MDNSQFVRGKGPILTEYLRSRKKVSDGTAAKGFTFEPGFMYDIHNDLEADTKFKLSDLNYSILSAAVERKLKQSGLDYDLAYKNASIAWESDKQALLAAWDRELSNLKREMGFDEEVVKKLAIEVSRRSALLIAAKTAIELEAESIRKQIADLDGTPGEYEMQLANAKLLTAEKKLETIPYIQQIIAIEEDIIEKENELVNKEETIVGIEEDIGDKDLEIVGKNQEIVNKQTEILSAQTDLNEVNTRLLDAKEILVDEGTLLVAAEKASVELRQALVTPALEALIATMDRYITELAVQLALYNEIAEIKADTVTVKEEQAVKMELVLEKRRAIADLTIEIATLLSDLTDYKISELAPVLSELVDVYERYADEIEAQIELRTAIAEVKANVALLIPQRVEKELAISDAKVSLEAQNRALNTARLAIDTQNSLNRVAKLVQENINLIEYTGYWGGVQAEEQSARETSFNTVITNAKLVDAKRLDINTANSLRVDEAQREAYRDLADAYEDMKEDEADLRTAEKGITARLSHLLTQE